MEFGGLLNSFALRKGCVALQGKGEKGVGLTALAWSYGKVSRSIIHVCTCLC